MLFHSRHFLFIFLPIVVLGYFLVTGVARAVDPGGKRFGQTPRNAWLLLSSLGFYTYGEGRFVLWLLVSVVANFLLGLALARARERELSKVREPGHGPVRGGRSVLILGLTANLALLAWFKYANFFFGGFAEDWVQIALPIGISFYTFQALSYLIDLYRGQAEVQRRPLDFALYISLFPQLIAGPIVRYRDLAGQLAERTCSLELAGSGVRRFVIGLGKKLIVADSAARIADGIFGLPSGELSLTLAWAGTVMYSIQLYFDFSGYSDMAIGLGRIFGFRILENFRWPYVAQSITEFWRRWHISLSTWFRDYLYVPMGGNRGGALRMYLNLWTVFLLCGLWHGAAWHYVIFGGFHGTFLVLERLGLGAWLERMFRPLRHVYVHLVLLFSWVLFRWETMPDVLAHWRALIGLSTPVDAVFREGMWIDRRFYVVLAVGALGALPWQPALARWRAALGQQRTLLAPAFDVLRGACFCALWVLCLGYAAAQTQSPFIYFRF